MPTIKQLYATKAQWAAENPVLADGEIGLEAGPDMSISKFKIGNGFASWSELPYFSSEEGRYELFVSRDEANTIYSPLGPKLYNPAGIRRWRAKLGDALESRCEITWIGHSIVFGKGSANINTETDLQAKDASCAGRLRRGLAREVGVEPGEGWLKLDDGRVTNSGSTSSPNNTMLAKGRRLQAGQSVTIALPSCTDIDVMIWKDSATSTGVPTFNVDAGVDVTPQQPVSGNDYFAVLSITGLPNTSHSLVLKGPATGSAYVSGVRPRVGPPLGVGVNRLGVAGSILSQLSGPGDAVQKNRVRHATIVGTKTDLLILQCDTNDESAEGGATSASAWKDDAQQWVDVATANGASTLIIGDPRKKDANSNIEDGYAEAGKQLALSNTHCSYIRIADWWGTYEQGDALGLYNGGSTVHPSRRGHGEIELVIRNILTGRTNSGILLPA